MYFQVRFQENFYVLHRDMQLPLGHLAGEKFQVCKETTQNWLSLPLLTKHTTNTSFSLLVSTLFSHQIHLAGITILIDLMVSIQFTYLEVSEPNLTWNTPTWKAWRRLISTFNTWDEAKETQSLGLELLSSFCCKKGSMWWVQKTKWPPENLHKLKTQIYVFIAQDCSVILVSQEEKVLTSTTQNAGGDWLFSCWRDELWKNILQQFRARPAWLQT